MSKSHFSPSGEKNTVEFNNSNNSNSESDNGKSSNINYSGGNKSGKTNSIPGFELIGGLTCLYGGWRLRKR
jgi:hypothetical protein